MTTIQIQRVSPPTDKQKEANIFGSCNLLILSENDSPIAYLNNITIRLNTKTNTKFLAPPNFKYNASGVDKYMNYFSLFPLGDNDSIHETQKESLRALTSEVIRHAENGGKNNHPKSYQSSSGSSSPVASQLKNKSPWE